VGIGEMAMVSTAPAIVNAIRDATGAMVFQLPATPERVKAAMTARAAAPAPEPELAGAAG
jgi:aldehyde oxidoreductase